MEPVQVINRRLEDLFGRFHSLHPLYRVSFADDEREKRYGTYDDFVSGIFIRQVTEVREVPKYPYIKSKYVLERLTIVPEFNREELLDQKFSYEPIWVFEDKQGNPLPPKWEVIEIVLYSLHKNLGQSRFAKYTEDPEERSKAILKLEEELFGDESEITDALTYKQGIVVPNAATTKRPK